MYDKYLPSSSFFFSFWPSALLFDMKITYADYFASKTCTTFVKLIFSENYINFLFVCSGVMSVIISSFPCHRTCSSKDGLRNSYSLGLQT